MNLIIIPAITYNGQPVLWSYNDTGSAVCLYRIYQGTETVINELLNKQLEQTPYISFQHTKEGRRAVITDMSHFKFTQVVPEISFAEMPRPKSSPPVSPQTPSEFLKSAQEESQLPALHARKHRRRTGTLVKSPRGAEEKSIIAPLNFFSPASSSSAAPRLHRAVSETPAGNKPATYRADRVALIEEKDSPEQSIAVDDLNFTSIYRDTFVYEQEFVDKTRSDSSNRLFNTIKSTNNLFIELQYQTNEVIYPVKQELAQTLRYLLDKQLNPAFKECIEDGDHVTPFIKKFFEENILVLMKPQEHLFKPTRPEKKPHLYPEHRRFDAIRLHKLTRIKEELWKLRFFYTDELSADYLTPDSYSNQLLSRLKQQLTPVRAEIAQTIDKLENLMLDLILKIPQRHLAEHELMEKIHHHEPVIDGFHSFYHMLENDLLHPLLKNALQHTSGRHKQSDKMALEPLLNDIARAAIDKIAKFYITLSGSGRPEETLTPEEKENLSLIPGEFGTVRGGQSDFYISLDLKRFWSEVVHAETHLHLVNNRVSLKKALDSKKTRPEKTVLIDVLTDSLIKNLKTWLHKRKALKDQLQQDLLPPCSSDNSAQTSSHAAPSPSPSPR